MRTFLSASIFSLLLMLAGCSSGGPSVVPHPSSPAIKVWDNKFVLVQEFSDPKTVKMIQGIFRRSKRVGDTKSHLKTSTHKIDFSDRWIVDLNSGEIGVLSKAVEDVYQIQPRDLKALQTLIEAK